MAYLQYFIFFYCFPICQASQKFALYFLRALYFQRPCMYMNLIHFSFLDIGFILEALCKNFKTQNIQGTIQKFLLFISLSFVTLEVMICTGKIIDKPTGTLQTLKEIDNISYSITICSPNYNANLKIPPLSVKDINGTWNDICTKKGCNRKLEKFVSKYKDYDDTESCETLPIYGKQVRIETQKRMYAKSKTIILYVHETGSFHSEFRLSIPNEALTLQTTILLTNEIFKQLPNENCIETEAESFDSCFNNFLQLKMNESAGCIIRNAW